MVDITFIFAPATHVVAVQERGENNQKIRMIEETKGWGRDKKEMVKMVEGVFK